MNNSIASLIIETRVSDADRLTFLPRHFGSHLLRFEHAVYAHLGHLSEDYQGGCWDYFELSNDGCYMAPAGEAVFKITVEGNGYSGVFGAKASGIIASLFALSSLSFKYRRFPRFADRFHQLRDFALERADAGGILAAID